MGLFDSVIAKCPSCGEDVEFQSKAYYPTGKEFRVPNEKVPLKIAADLIGTVEKCVCGTEVGFSSPDIVTDVELRPFDINVIPF